ncbi:MAG: zinc carboxypeptidase [Candidatus Cloacimonetes bacterium]|nr:zinc carboxypeptidase [Candidatus Cloacimonadota bacterium]
MRKLAISAIILLNTACVMAAPIMRVPNTASSRVIVNQLNLDYTSRTPEYIEFVYDEEAKQRLIDLGHENTSFFKKTTITNKNADEQFSELMRKDDLGIYHTYEEIVTELNDYASTYPGLAKVIQVGTTFEGRNIIGIEIGNQSNQDRVPFLVMGTHHAREWIASEVPMASVKDLLESYESDAQAKKIVDSSTIVYVPMLNIDGGIYSRNGSPMWRKNRNANNKGGVGVDNNRNYEYKWGVTGASSSPWSDTYKGEEPMSENENQAVESLYQKYKFKSSISFHSYSELVLWPWGYTSSIQCKDNEIFKKIGTGMGEIMGYRPMQSADLYPAAGDSDDYLYAKHGVLAYTIELGRRFVPSESKVPEINSKGSKALRYFFENARNPFEKVVENKEYKVLKSLEYTVYALERAEYDTQTLQDAYQKLATFTKQEIQTGMNTLKMKHRVKKHIEADLSTFERFKKHNQ